jgi:Spy/CpxP family protein refolding chaperone
MRTSILLLIILLTAVYFTSAQDKESGRHKGHNHQQPESEYKSEINNEIKSLSSEEIEQLFNGAGMGLAKAAELNSYPGPKHVLELSSDLNLTQKQKAKTEDLFRSVKTEAKKIGHLVVQKEKELDSLFKENLIDEYLLQNKISEIAELKGKLRFTHLNTHLKQKEILTVEQVKKYNKVRGYSY